MIIKIQKTNSKDDYVAYNIETNEISLTKAISFLLGILKNDVTDYSDGVTGSSNIFYDINRNKEHHYKDNEELFELLFADQYGDYQFFKIDINDLILSELVEIAVIISSQKAISPIRDEAISQIEKYSDLI